MLLENEKKKMYTYYLFILGVVLYKSIMLSNNERTPQVIRNAMLKFCIDDDPENYTLSQVLPDKGLFIYYCI